MRTHAILFLFLSLSLVGCKVPERDPLASGERLAEQGQFLDALVSLDRVPPSHPRYTEARTLAQALERRIRTSQEKILHGLSLRGEWRDEEAIDQFQQAIDIWADVVAARGLMQATQNRIAALGTVRGSSGALQAKDGEPTVGEVETTPVDEGVGPTSTPAKPAGETAVRKTQIEKAEPGTERAATEPAAKPTKKLRRQHRLALAQRVLRRGDMDGALDVLEDLWDETPGDRQVATQLVRVLHQRALLAYGQGRLEASVDDWRKALRLDEGNDQVRAFLRAAETELAARQRR